MESEILKLQCPNCGATIQFDIENDIIKCNHCESEFPADFFNLSKGKSEEAQNADWRVKSLKKEYVELENYSGLVCTACGAEVINDSSTVATECIYCGNAVVMVDNIKGMLSPDSILPFKIGKEQAQNMLKKFYKGKILLPNDFGGQNRIDKIAGTYVPFWLFSGKGVYNFKYEPIDTSTVRQGEYLITKTKHYDLQFAGEIEYKSLPVDATSKMEDDYMDGLEPYDFNELRDFAPSYMAGFYAEKFDTSVDDCTKRAKDRIFFYTQSDVLGAKGIYMEKRKKKIKHTKLTLKSEDYSLQNEKIEYALLPVWMLNTRYKGKMYHFAINGQTGRVSGELPIDKTKQILLFLSMFIGTSTAISLLIYLIIFFFGGVM